eukprot:CAMPEP_0117537826 /NCGR_PEP_ID=MMETSP0784-20121206/42168_1 /TAXON_ID=39447 /ORGANISM="" /LENGTH=167 /DNA_ID=CAMNT_0005334431 /DNA_START=86 /DNA_END=589 /DNA_ORIENTATION=+
MAAALVVRAPAQTSRCRAWAGPGEAAAASSRAVHLNAASAERRDAAAAAQRESERLARLLRGASSCEGRSGEPSGEQARLGAVRDEAQAQVCRTAGIELAHAEGERLRELLATAVGLAPADRQAESEAARTERLESPGDVGSQRDECGGEGEWLVLDARQGTKHPAA